MSLYAAEGLRIVKRPVHRKTETGTNISLGFPVCTVTEYVGEEGAKTVAAMLDAAERHDALVEALRAAREVVKVAEALTSSRGDDDWIWDVLAKIDAALETPANPIEEVVDDQPGTR